MLPSLAAGLQAGFGAFGDGGNVCQVDTFPEPKVADRSSCLPFRLSMPPSRSRPSCCSPMGYYTKPHRTPSVPAFAYFAPPCPRIPQRDAAQSPGSSTRSSQDWFPPRRATPTPNSLRKPTCLLGSPSTRSSARPSPLLSPRRLPRLPSRRSRLSKPGVPIQPTHPSVAGPTLAPPAATASASVSQRKTNSPPQSARCTSCRRC